MPKSRIHVVAGELDDDTHAELERRFPNRPRSKPAEGKQGPRGYQGDEGPHGKRGRQGEPGKPGAAGADGKRGPRGPAGEDGLSIHQDAGAPPSEFGADGDSFLDNKSGDLYRKESGEWRNTGNLRGPKGKPGASGSQGVSGPRGFRGPRGYDRNTDLCVLFGEGPPPDGGITGQTMFFGDGEPPQDWE